MTEICGYSRCFETRPCPRHQRRRFLAVSRGFLDEKHEKTWHALWTEMEAERRRYLVDLLAQGQGEELQELRPGEPIPL